MDDDSKKRLWRILKVALFLFFSIIFIMPYLIQISTYFHERAHRAALLKYGVQSSYRFDLYTFLTVIPNTFFPKGDALGVTHFNSQQYDALDKYQKIEVHVAGIVSDLTIIFLISVYLILSNLYLYYRLKIQKNENVGFILAINWILFMWFVSLIPITIANITYPTGDIYQLINLIK